MEVVKRNGERQILDITKIQRQVEWACEGLKVSQSDIELASQLKFYDGIQTKDIHDTLVKSAADLITVWEPDYSRVAGRLNNHQFRKEAYNDINPPALLDHVQNVIDLGMYDPSILEAYTPTEFGLMDSFIDHTRDFELEYVATEQFKSKYLVRDRSNPERGVVETPQMLYIMVAATLAINEPKATRMQFVHDAYEAISQHYISLPTPIMAGVRTPTRQFSSCVLIECDDSLDSIGAVASTIMQYVSKRAGIGIQGGAIRALGSKIGNGEVLHTGLVPFWKLFQTAVHSCSQGGVRGGAATVYYPMWHLEYEDLIVLKNNRGTEENRIRRLDYAIQTCGLFARRYVEKGNITLFSPDVAGGQLYKLFYEDMEKFEKLYVELENDPTVPKKVVSASDVWTKLVLERSDTGRIYLHWVDVTIKGTPFDPETAPVRMSNLCVSGDTQILTSLGHKTISSLVGKQVDVWNGSEFSTVTIEKTGENQELVEVELSDGKSLKCTPYHKWYVVTGARNGGEKEVRAHELKPGDRLVKWNAPAIEGTLSLSNAYTNGFYTGDGCKVNARNRVYLYGDKQNLIEDITGNVVRTCVQPSQDRTYVDLIGLENKFFVPNAAYTIEARLSWLAGYLDADGCVYRNQDNEQLTCASTEFDFLVNLQLMLQTLGVQSKIVDGQDAGLRWMPANDSSGENKLYQCKQTWRLLINSGDTLHLQNLGLPVKRLKLHAHEPQRNAAHFVRVVSVTSLQEREDTYCFNEPKRHKGVFNGLLTGQCLEIALPTKAQESVDDPNAEVALCTLAALNWGKMELVDVKKYMALAVRLLDNLLSYQDYIVPAAKRFTDQFRALGIGAIGYAHFLAKKDFRYGQGLKETRELAEHMQYYGLLESTRLASERGRCEGFDRLKYAKGWLKADATPAEDKTLDWEYLRGEIQAHGLRNSTVMAFMPSETSSQISNETSGLEPPHGLVSSKKSKSGVLTQVVPEVETLFNSYTTCWEVADDNRNYLNALGEIMKFNCQAISANTWYVPARHNNNKVPAKILMRDILHARKVGLPTLYYQNTNDEADLESQTGCESGACSI